MKLKCKHERRVLVLPSGNTVHRNDGSACEGKLTLGDNKVSKLIKDGNEADFVLAILKPVL